MPGKLATWMCSFPSKTRRSYWGEKDKQLDQEDWWQLTTSSDITRRSNSSVMAAMAFSSEVCWRRSSLVRRVIVFLFKLIHRERRHLKIDHNINCDSSSFLQGGRKRNEVVPIFSQKTIVNGCSRLRDEMMWLTCLWPASRAWSFKIDQSCRTSWSDQQFGKKQMYHLEIFYSRGPWKS